MRESLNDKDLLLFKELQLNCRESFAKISRKLDLPQPNVYRSYDALEQNLILKNTALINPEVLGYNLKEVIVFAHQDISEIDSIKLSPNVNTLYKAYDKESFFIAECYFKNFNSSQQFKDNLSRKGFVIDSCSYITSELKKELFEFQN